MAILYDYALNRLVIFVALLGYLPWAVADWKYKSRPDLSPPALNITVSASSDVSEGYIFIAPYSVADLHGHPPQAQGLLQTAPHIFTTAGDLVWSGFGYFGSYSGNFQAGKYRSENVLFAFEGSKYIHGHGRGHAKILNSNYETIREVRGADHSLLDIHEFQIFDENTALVSIWQPKPFNSKPFGLSPKSQWIAEAKFQGMLNELRRGAMW